MERTAWDELVDSVEAKLISIGGKTKANRILYRCQCPEHDQSEKDHNASYNKDINGFLCHSCGAQGGLVKLANQLGIQSHIGGRPIDKIVDAWRYRHSQSATVKIRVDDPSKKSGKTYSFYNCDSGSYSTGKSKTSQLPIYNSHLLEQPGDVWIAEGERKADTLTSLGVIGISSGGASSADSVDWSSLRGRTVVLWPDNDKAGSKYVLDLVAILRDVAASVSVIEADQLGIKEKGDVVDWFLADPSRDSKSLLELPRRLMRDAIEASDMISFADLIKTEYKPIDWLVQDLIPIGATMLAGGPKRGKSWMVLQIAIAVANGTDALGFFKTKRSDVQIFALEDNPRLMHQRLVMLESQESGIVGCGEHGVCPPNVYYSTTMPTIRKDGIKALESYIKRNSNIRLYIIDTLQKFRGPSNGKNGASYDDDVEFVTAINQMAIDNDVAIIVVHHTRKKQPIDDFTDDPAESVLGGQGLTGSVTQTLILKRKAKEQTATMHIQSRVAQEREVSLTFSSGCIWSYTASDDDISATDNDLRVIEAIKAHGMTHVSVGKMVEYLGATPNAVYQMVARALSRGSVVRAKRGQYSLDSVTLTALIQKREAEQAKREALRIFASEKPALHIVAPTCEDKPEAMSKDFKCADWGILSGSLIERDLRNDKTKRAAYAARYLARKGIKNGS